MHLTSPQNPLIKEIRRALAKGTLTADGFCFAEGFHTVEEAIRSGCEIGGIFLAESVRDEAGRFERDKIISVPDKLFASISSTESPQGVMALVRAPDPAASETLFGDVALVFVIDGVQDPGNAGAVLRSAEAFGSTGVIFLRGSAWPYNPKAIRASAGSVFRVPLNYDLSVAEVLGLFRRWEVDVYAAMPRSEMSVTEADLRRPCAFIIGAEGRGVSTHLADATIPIHIPTREVESLNAAVAAAILAYEAWRQRHQGT